jgi:bacterioferritin-associated ferredoxin
MYICLCNGITDKQIKNAVRQEGVGNVRDLKHSLNVGNQCGRCVQMAQDIIDATIVDESLFKDVG